MYDNFSRLSIKNILTPFHLMITRAYYNGCWPSYAKSRGINMYDVWYCLNSPPVFEPYIFHKAIDQKLFFYHNAT